MMAQSTIDTFFANRKRHAADDLKGKSSKIIALDSDSVSAGYGHTKSNEISGHAATRIKVEATVVFPIDDAAKSKPQRVAVSTPATPKARTPVRTRRTTKAKDALQTDMKIFLRSTVDAKPESGRNDALATPLVPCSNERALQENETASAPVEEQSAVKEEPTVEDNQRMPSSFSAELDSHVKPEAVAESGDEVMDKAPLQVREVKPATKESNIEKARKVGIILPPKFFLLFLLSPFSS